ncbi:hypothetical protein HDV04_000616 [Boothiomyces sp. JEL0838]|nr:hypothetical protein HDV04_000616 [Boothiomyces sp. JEL0838]
MVITGLTLDRLEVSFEVIQTPGDWAIDYEIKTPGGATIHKVTGERASSFGFNAASNGEHHQCFDNRSGYEKNVQFSFLGPDDQSKIEIGKDMSEDEKELGRNIQDLSNQMRKKSYFPMVGQGENNVNGRKRNLFKEKRQEIQRLKKKSGTDALSLLQKTNQQITPIIDSVVSASIKKQDLISDKPFNTNKIKLVSGVRPGRMGKHGVYIRPARINKKKVKKLLKNKKLEILEAIEKKDIDMD